MKRRELKEVLNESKGREPKGQHDPHAILFLVTRKLFLGSTLTFEMVVVKVYTWFDSYLKKNQKPEVTICLKGSASKGTHGYERMRNLKVNQQVKIGNILGKQSTNAPTMGTGQQRTR